MSGRGTGSVFHRVFRDKKTGELKETRTWWIRYYYRGKKKEESSGSTKRSDANRLLKKRMGEMGSGKTPGFDIEKTTFDDLSEMLLNDYRANARKSAVRNERSVKKLSKFFGGSRAIDITADRVLAYVIRRQTVSAENDKKAKNATINRELAALKRMLRLGVRFGKLHAVPPISLLRENNVRKGFFEREQFDAVLRHLPEDVRPVVIVAYITGWRLNSEILSRQWHHVDLNAGWLRLEPGETKNGKGRNFPFTPELREVLQAQRRRTQAIEYATGQIIPWVFHREGRPIKSFRDSWKNACKKAGVPGRIPHDFRRTAVRNLERAGVPRSDAKAMVGHLTDSIYNRYAISDEASLKESATKLARFHDGEKKPGEKVSRN